MLPVTPSFDYTLLSAELAADLRQKAEVIRLVNKMASEAFILIGNALIAAKQALGHGKFSDWVERECGFSLRTAQRHMQVAEFTKDKSAKLACLPQASLERLSAKSAPPAIVEAVLSRVETGEVVGVVEIGAALDEARCRRRADKKRQDQAARRSKRTVAKNEARRQAEADRMRADEERVRLVAVGLIESLGEERVRLILDALQPGDDWRVLQHLRRECKGFPRRPMQCPRCEEELPEKSVDDFLEIPEFLLIENRGKPFRGHAD